MTRFAGSNEFYTGLSGLADANADLTTQALVGGMRAVSGARARKTINDAQLEHMRKTGGSGRAGGDWGPLAAAGIDALGGLFRGGGGGGGGGINWNSGFQVDRTGAFDYKGSFL